jgi:hypothetical protein
VPPIRPGLALEMLSLRDQILANVLAPGGDQERKR